MPVLAIDQGTSGTKAVVVDDDGTVLSLAEEPVHPIYLPDGGVEQAPDELLRSVRDAGQRAVREAGTPIEVMALANQGESVLAWDPSTGEPLTTVLVWQDSRSQVVCDALTEHGPQIAERTGLVLDPYFSAPKMAWLRRNLTTDGVVTTTDSWLVHALTGEFVTDVTTASRSLLLDLDSVSWSEELVRLFGLGGERLPRLVACDEVIGTTSAFGAPMPVAGLVVDQQSALFAEGCLAPGTAKCTYGTGAFLLANAGPSAPRSTGGLTTSVAWRTREGTQYCLDGQVYTAASAVRWMAELGLVESAADLDALADDDDGGALFVPALAGLAAPWWRSDAAASFTGLRLSTTRGHLVRAVILGIAAQVAALADVMEHDLGAPMDTVRVDGGLTRSRVLMQAQADVLQRPLEVYPSPHATPLGAAAFARLAVDPRRSVADAQWPWRPTTVFEPRWSADRAREFLGRWTAAVEASL